MREAVGTGPARRPPRRSGLIERSFKFFTDANEVPSGGQGGHQTVIRSRCLSERIGVPQRRHGRLRRQKTGWKDVISYPSVGLLLAVRAPEPEPFLPGRPRLAPPYDGPATSARPPRPPVHCVPAFGKRAGQKAERSGGRLATGLVLRRQEFTPALRD